MRKITQVKIEPSWPNKEVKEVWKLLRGIHCPHCGTQNVWEDGGGEDYYLGPLNVCLDCLHSFSLTGPELLTQQSYTWGKVQEVLAKLSEVANEKA